MSTRMKMLPQYCKILIRHEVQKQFENGRELMEVVLEVLHKHMKSFKTQAKERTEADINLRQIEGQHEDIKEVLVTLASLQKDTSASLRELSKRIDGPVTLLSGWLTDPSTKQLETFIVGQIGVLTDQHAQTVTKLSKLQKVYNKKLRMMEKVQQQIDRYDSFSGSNNMSLSDLKIKLEHLTVETEAAGQRYRDALDNEILNRLEFIKDVEELDCLFVKYEEKRLSTLVDCIGKYSTILTGYYSNPSDKTRAILTDLTELSILYSPDDQIQKFLASGYRELSFPAPQEECVSKNPIHHIGQDDLNLYLESMVPSVSSTEQLTRTSDTSGNAKRRLDEKNGDRSKDVYTQYMDTKASGLPINHFHGDNIGKNSESTIHPITPKDVVPDERSKLTPSTPRALPVIAKPYMHEDTPVKATQRILTKMERLPQIASPEIAIHRIMSREEKRPAQFLRCDSSLEGNLLPKLPRSMTGTPEMTSSQYKEAMIQSPLKPKHNVDNSLPFMPKSMVENGEMSALRSQSRNGSSSPHPAVRGQSRMEGNVLPKMPNTGNGMLSSPFKAKSNQDNVKPGELPPWVKSKTTFLPQLPIASKDSVESASLQPKIKVESVPARLPLMLRPGANTANATLSYARPDSRSDKPPVPNRKEGFSILPSKPKVLMDIGNTQSFMVRSTAENIASDTLRSRHRVGVVRQSGQVDSGIAAGFRGSSSNRDFKPQQGMANGPQGSRGMVNTAQGQHGMVNTAHGPQGMMSTAHGPQGMMNTAQGPHRIVGTLQAPQGLVNIPHGPHKLMNTQQRPQGLVNIAYGPNKLMNTLQGPQGMAVAPPGPRGKADGAPYMTQVLDSNPALKPQRARAGTTTSSWMRNEHLPEGSSKDKCVEQVKLSNADRLLSKYDVRKLGIGDNEQEDNEDICKRADRLLAMHDIRNICSEESLVEQQM